MQSVTEFCNYSVDNHISVYANTWAFEFNFRHWECAEYSVECAFELHHFPRNNLLWAYERLINQKSAVIARVS